MRVDELTRVAGHADPRRWSGRHRRVDETAAADAEAASWAAATGPRPPSGDVPAARHGPPTPPGGVADRLRRTGPHTAPEPAVPTRRRRGQPVGTAVAVWTAALLGGIAAAVLVVGAAGDADGPGADVGPEPASAVEETVPTTASTAAPSGPGDPVVGTPAAGAPTTAAPTTAGTATTAPPTTAATTTVPPSTTVATAPATTVTTAPATTTTVDASTTTSAPGSSGPGNGNGNGDDDEGPEDD